MAKELIFTGRIIGAQEALRIGIHFRSTSNFLFTGLVSYVEANAYHKAIALAQEIKSQGPIAIKMAKIAIDSGHETTIEQGLNIEKCMIVF